jgi:hypothetical protein
MMPRVQNPKETLWFSGAPSGVRKFSYTRVSHFGTMFARTALAVDLMLVLTVCTPTKPPFNAHTPLRSKEILGGELSQRFQALARRSLSVETVLSLNLS